MERFPCGSHGILILLAAWDLGCAWPAWLWGLLGSHRLGGPSTADDSKELSQMLRRQGKSQDQDVTRKDRKVKLYEGVVEQCWVCTLGYAVI